jgi:hypothetical protein
MRWRAGVVSFVVPLFPPSAIRPPLSAEGQTFCHSQECWSKLQMLTAHKKCFVYTDNNFFLMPDLCPLPSGFRPLISEIWPLTSDLCYLSSVHAGLAVSL